MLFRILTTTGEHNSLAIIVHLEHQFLGTTTAKPEMSAKNIGNIGHKINGIVPDDYLPRRLRFKIFVNRRLKLSGI